MPDGFAHYDFALPDHLIAQRPAERRDGSRLMLLERGRAGVAHHTFTDLPTLLPPGALLVVNNTRVPPRRLAARLPSGVAIEALLVAETDTPGLWRAKVKKARRLKTGMPVPFAQGHLPARAVERTEGGDWLLAFEAPETLAARLDAHGLAPLPPYIRRDVHRPHDAAADRAAYQTTFARVDGAIAAPTAGLHFTPAVLAALRAAGVEITTVTLHVGEGTFAKVQVDDPALHRMHAEWSAVPAATAAAIHAARAACRPVIAVGTTTVRTLEAWAAAGMPPEDERWTDLYIRPGFRFQVVDGLLTNFHMPRSTLLLLVAAFHGRERLLEAYAEAVRQEYRFFSFGDCMLIAPAARDAATPTHAHAQPPQAG